MLKIDEYTINVLNTKEIRKLLYSLKPDNPQSFRVQYQDAYVSRPDDPHLTLYDLLTKALVNSEQTYQQYEVSPASVKKLAKEVFVEDMWLKRDPTVAVCDGQYYLIGGRHRVLAIANVFAEIARRAAKDIDQQTEYFNELLSQEVRVEMLEVRDLNVVLQLIMSDNTSRTMRKSERAHLNAQLLGADAFNIEDLGNAVFYPDLPPKEVVAIAAQFFTRQIDRKTKPQTRQTVGELVAKYVLYGLLPNTKLTAKSKMVINTPEEFFQKMELAWKLYQELVSDKVVVAANAGQIANDIIREIITQAMSDTPETLGGVEEESTPFSEEPRRRRGRPKKDTQVF